MISPLPNRPPAPPAKRNEPLDGLTTHCTCQRVIDGDTVDVAVRKTLRIKLPESQRSLHWTPGERVSAYIPSQPERLSPVFESGFAAGCLLPPERADTEQDGVAIPQPPLGICSPAVVTRRVNAALIDVEVERLVRVRMRDCWACETRTRCDVEKRMGLTSKAHLADLCPVGTSLVLYVPASTRGVIASVLTLDRVLGWLWRHGEAKDLSQRQREAGHAWATKDEQTQALQRAVDESDSAVPAESAVASGVD